MLEILKLFNLLMNVMLQFCLKTTKLSLRKKILIQLLFYIKMIKPFHLFFVTDKVINKNLTKSLLQKKGSYFCFFCVKEIKWKQSKSFVEYFDKNLHFNGKRYVTRLPFKDN